MHSVQSTFIHLFQWEEGMTNNWPIISIDAHQSTISSILSWQSCNLSLVKKNILYQVIYQREAFEQHERILLPGQPLPSATNAACCSRISHDQDFSTTKRIMFLFLRKLIAFLSSLWALADIVLDTVTVIRYRAMCQVSRRVKTIKKYL